MTTNRLSLSLRAQHTSTKKPIFDVRVNDLVVQPSSVERLDPAQELFQYDQITERLRRIDIYLHNKQPADTLLDGQGRIVEDLLLIVDSLRVDHVDLTNKLEKISVYRDIQGNRHRTFNYITFAGHYQIKLHRNLLYTEWLASYK